MQEKGKWTPFNPGAYYNFSEKQIKKNMFHGKGEIVTAYTCTNPVFHGLTILFYK